jgi:hypothetical protein
MWLISMPLIAMTMMVLTGQQQSEQPSTTFEFSVGVGTELFILVLL